MFPALLKFAQPIVFADVRSLERVLNWWDEHEMFSHTRWLAYFFAISRKNFCTYLNHPKGLGCFKDQSGECLYIHECALCHRNHGAFSLTALGGWVCPAQKNLDLQLELAQIDWPTFLTGAERLRQMYLEGMITGPQNPDFFDAAYRLLTPRTLSVSGTNAVNANILTPASLSVSGTNAAKANATEKRSIEGGAEDDSHLAVNEERMGIVSYTISQLRARKDLSDNDLEELDRLETFLQDLRMRPILNSDLSFQGPSVPGSETNSEVDDRSLDEQPPEDTFPLPDGCILTLKADNANRLSAEGQRNGVFKAKAQLGGFNMEVAVKILILGKQKYTTEAKERKSSGKLRWKPF